MFRGRFLALRATNTSNLGASAISFVPLAKGIAIASSVYDIPCSYIRGRAVVTNTAPTSAYRSAGRPEVVFVLERIIDIACRRHGFDRLEIRRRNLVPPKAMPYRHPVDGRVLSFDRRFLEGLKNLLCSRKGTEWGFKSNTHKRPARAREESHPPKWCIRLGWRDAVAAE